MYFSPLRRVTACTVVLGLAMAHFYPTLPEAKGVYQGFQYNAFLKRHLPSCYGIAGFELIIVTDTTYSELNYFHQVVQYEKVRDNSFLDTTRSPRLVSVNPTVCCRN